MRTSARLFLVCLLCALPALGLEPYLVKDINPVSADNGSAPSNFVSLGSVAVFVAYEGTILGVWRSDGTHAGTWPVATVCVAGDTACRAPEVLAVAGGRCFMTFGPDVWVTDGTVSGTLRLTDGLSSTTPGAVWVPEQRVLYFAAADPEHGRELWRTDGTQAGTYLVTDLEPGPKSAQPLTLTAFRGRIWFAAQTAADGGSLWSSDGTKRGTVPAYRTGRPVELTVRGVVGGRLLFSEPFGRDHKLRATDGTRRGALLLALLRHYIWDSVVQGRRLFFVSENPGHGQELWVSDGTVRGTRVVSDIPGKQAFFGSGDEYRLYLPRTSLSGRFLFQAWDPAHGRELWTSNGTPAGTRLVRDVCPGACGGPLEILAANQGLLYFSGTDGARGLELWATDGTGAGTRMVRDLCPGSCGSIPKDPSLFAGRLLFAADDGVNGRELWSTNGTAAGTIRLTDVAPPDPEASFAPGAAVGGLYLFAADDGEEGSELWGTDGKPTGTRLVEDINQADFGGSMPTGFRELGGQAVFFADDGIHGYELWKSDGTAGGTSLVADLVPGPEPLRSPRIVSSVNAGGKLFLILWEGGGDNYSLWRTDGTAAGTVRILGPDERPGAWSSGLCAVGDTVFATLTDGGLWATDASMAGMRQVVEGDQLFVSPMGLTEFAGGLYFFATGRDGSFGLWRSDGTAAGTVRVRSFGAPFSFLPWPTVRAGRLWFFAATPDATEIWSSDGTAAGTRIEPLLDIPMAPFFLASLGGTLVFSARFGESDLELWATDGTPEGTRRLGPAVDTFYDWTVFQGRLVYAADERFDNHPKLWTSDGTAEGTGPLLDHGGQPIPPALGFAALENLLIFTTADPPAVWQTEGTAAGTFPIAPQRPVGDNEGAVVRAGNRVFFGAWEPETGQELWAVEP